MRGFLSVILLLNSAVLSQTAVSPQQSGAELATITGRVTCNGAPVRGALIVARRWHQSTTAAILRDKSDANGSYRIASLEPGKYLIMASAPPYAPPDTGMGREVTIDAGETREINFSMLPGGAISGQVVDSDGRPVVDQRISIILSSGSYGQPFHGDDQMMTTDDRGVYRVYGIPPGHYTVSLGDGTGAAQRRLDYGQNYYPLTYYPDKSDPSRPGIVGLTEGAEVSGIDIVVGRRMKTHEASGRIVDAETGKPQAGINWGYGGNAMSTFGRRSDENGSFKITGLTPGHYSVFAGCEGDFYSDQVEFEITDHDVTGLEIRRSRGASISGKVVVERVTDPGVLGRLAQMSLSASSGVHNVGSPIDGDGSFYFCGLRPGRVKISANSWRQSGFSVLRVERGGQVLAGGIDVSPGDHVTEVRIVFGYATGIIRGQVSTPGCELPQGLQFQISAQRLGDDNAFIADTDDRGRFVMEGLPPGEYELSMSGFSVRVSANRVPTYTALRQRVTVSSGTESSAAIVVNAAGSTPK